MKRTKKGTPWRFLIIGLVFALVAAACGGDDTGDTTTTTGGTTVPAGDFGTPETDKVIVANRLPDLGSNVQVEGASNKGWFAEEGLEVEIVQVEDVRAALASGSVQVAAMEPGILMQALAEGLDFVVISGHRCGQLNTFAIQPDIPNAAALAGRDVLVGGVPGTPDADLRLALLELNGWDLSEVDDINYVTVPGGSNAWTELFYEDKLALTPFFGRHRDAMEEYGANIAVDTVVEWPDEFWVTTKEFVNENPNTLGHFVAPVVRMAQYWLDPANEDEIVNDVMADRASDVEQAGNLEASQFSFCANNYVNEEYTINALEAAGVTDIPPMSVWADLQFLLPAQAKLGLDNEGTPGAIHTPFGGDAAAPADYGPSETDKIVVANRLPDLASNVQVEGTSLKGWFDEEGIEVETVQVEDVRAALASGSVQVVAMEPGILMQARAEGLDFVAISGHRCGQLNTFAIQPYIVDASELAGEDVLVGGIPGTPDADLRLALLKINGWDLSEVEGINYVTVPGGSNAWTELFYEDKLALTPFFGRHRVGMEEYGANIAVDTVVEWPDEFWVAERDWVEENPNAVGRFVRQVVRMAQYWLDPANETDILTIMDDRATDVQKAGDLESSMFSFCPNNYINEEYTINALEAASVEDIPPISEWAVLPALLAAQATWGMDNEGTPGAIHTPFQ